MFFFWQGQQTMNVKVTQTKIVSKYILLRKTIIFVL